MSSVVKRGGPRGPGAQGSNRGRSTELWNSEEQCSGTSPSAPSERGPPRGPPRVWKRIRLPGEGGKGRSAESASTDPSQRGKGPYAERERDEGRRGVSAMGTVRAALGAVRRLRGDHDRGDDADPEVLLCGRAPRPAHVCGPRVARP